MTDRLIKRDCRFPTSRSNNIAALYRNFLSSRQGKLGTPRPATSAAPKPTALIKNTESILARIPITQLLVLRIQTTIPSRSFSVPEIDFLRNPRLYLQSRIHQPVTITAGTSEVPTI